MTTPNQNQQLPVGDAAEFAEQRISFSRLHADTAAAVQLANVKIPRGSAFVAQLVYAKNDVDTGESITRQEITGGNPDGTLVINAESAVTDDLSAAPTNDLAVTAAVNGDLLEVGIATNSGGSDVGISGYIAITQVSIVNG